MPIPAVSAGFGTGFVDRRNRGAVHPVQVDMLEHFLARHDGVITRAQAHECGISDDGIDRRVRVGKWQRRAAQVFFVADRPFGSEARIRCAVWGAGETAVASGEAAAFWHHLIAEAPQIVEVTVPRAGRSRAPGCRLRRRDLPEADIVERRGLRVTAIDLTVLEVSTRKTAVLDRALQNRTTLGNLNRAHLRNKGRAGAATSHRLLRAAAGGARSEAERLLIALLRAAKVTGFAVNFPFGGYVIDLAFPAEMLAIEVDGFAFHTSPQAFQHDRTRQNVLSNSWQILRYTWADLIERPQYVVAQIVAALDAIRCRSPR